MRIAKSHLLAPTDNGAFGIAALALSFFVFAYSTRFGPVAILAYYAAWLPLVLIDYRRVLGNYAWFGWIFAFALFCFLSAFWSQAPSVSLRAAVQYLTHIACALIAMRILTTTTLCRGAMVGCAVVLLYSLAFGGYHYDALDGSYSFVGAFSSKNQLGLYASLGVLFSYASGLLLRPGRTWQLASAATGLLSGYALFASQSATSVITTIAVVAAGLAMQLTMRLAPRQRRVLFAAAVVAVAGGGIAALQAGALDAILAVFGKDSTLTGRTYLWQQGIAAAATAPWFGVGYQGYWVQGFAEAERLWQDFFIASRSGFHFHNTYIETMVETGLVGTLLLAAVLLRSLFGHLRRFLISGRSPQSLAMVLIATLLLVRSFVEIDILHPYQVGSFLLYIAAGQLTRREPAALARPSRARSQAQSRPQPWPQSGPPSRAGRQATGPRR
ncbi:MAG: O-antigen ligase family protein [Alphaproteobacteria bacterium]|nr:O-antigen ligase family protein [Alphaproteobacteria bacterium]MBU1552273.1 O-antigen ligase family protein [Alphaproteobacteria bacterium]MBU2336819.1 O-antigen ligase family protein [Alphaproteobacteria bacterium]MBU2389575.1 O-antigen ligase family protein [Alphaproteobacteria bacterium]